VPGSSLDVAGRQDAALRAGQDVDAAQKGPGHPEQEEHDDRHGEDAQGRRRRCLQDFQGGRQKFPLVLAVQGDEHALDRG
jgi:hypothetical protein